MGSSAGGDDLDQLWGWVSAAGGGASNVGHMDVTLSFPPQFTLALHHKLPTSTEAVLSV